MSAAFHLDQLLGITTYQSIAILCVAIGVIGSIYAIFGGLKAVAVSDTVNGVGLLIGGLLIPILSICILGNGYAATSHITTLLPWLTTIPNIIYWGDMDANGLDILSKLRATGIPCTSILMDTTAYRTYEQYGTQLDAKNKPLTTQTPQPTPGLTTEERKLYETLCTGTDIQYLRIEQERIPIRDATTILHDQHHWPIDIPGNDIPNNNTK